MALESLKCPNCAASIQMDAKTGTGVCLHCGSTVQNKDETKHSGSVELSRRSEMQNLLVRAEEKIGEYQATRFAEDDVVPEAIKIKDNYIEKILDIQADNPRALELHNRLVDAQNAQLKRYKDARAKVIIFIILGNVLLVILLFLVICISAAFRFIVYLVAPVAFLVGSLIYILGVVCLIILGINGTPIGELVPAFLIIAIGGAIPLLHDHVLDFLNFVSEKSSWKIKTIMRPQQLQE